MHLQHWKFKGKAKATSLAITASSTRISSSSGQAATVSSQTSTARNGPAESLEVQMSEAPLSTL